MSIKQVIELTPEEAVGVETCIELLGMSHPTAVKLHAWLSSINIFAKAGTIEEMMSGVWKVVDFCKARSIVYPNVVDVRNLLVKRSNSQTVADQEATGTPA